MKKLRNFFEDVRDLVAATAQFAVYMPLYKLVVACERRNIHLPFRVIHAAVQGERRSKYRFEEITTHFFGYRWGYKAS